MLMTLIFFVLIEELYLKIINFFKKYGLATGATTNVSKAKITPLGNANIYNLHKQISNPKDFVKTGL